MKAEFLGIYLIYLHSKITAWRIIAIAAMAVSGILAGALVWKEHQLQLAYHDMEQGNSISCDSGYIAKIVDKGKVTCLMMRLGPGVVSRKERRR